MTGTHNILVVEDEPQLRRGIVDNLQLEGYTVYEADNCAKAREHITRHAPDLLILDRRLPDGDGLTICRDLRSNGCYTPVIMLTAKGEELDRVFGLESGADDYIVKPFSLRELLARVLAHLRRSKSWFAVDECVTIGAATIDFSRHEVERDGEKLEISSRELELLRYLVTRRGEVVSRDTILEHVWGRPRDIETRTVDNFIVRLRKKIELDPANPRCLITVHGSGYKLLTTA
ncbi:MAG: response regulator transcription factor [Pseudomonadales bacterium]|nr:response regulator transcription factor [Pseudomonadales bacterium]MCP5183895.1 response regulator transcription factor [Pseudomonadales bacterium]